MRLALICLLFLLGCRGRGAEERPAGSRRGKVSTPATPADAPTVHLGELPAGSPPLIVLTVLDAVRADALELCGGRPGTSDALTALVARGASYTCQSYAPATWTLPSHVTYFTGLDPLTHGQLRKGVHLDDDVTTLAEALQARGYQTLLISANPVLHEGTGVHQGFAKAVVANGLVGPLRGEGLARTVASELALLDPTRPVFLFLNIFDAHDPYPRVPAQTPGFTELPPFALNSTLGDENPWSRFMAGQMRPAEEEAWLSQARETYAFGVRLADQALGAVVDHLQTTPWFAAGARLVVTSDHGELLGEHRRMRHDGPAFEPVARVPLVVLDTTAAPPALPAPFPGAVVHALVRDGKLPATLPLPTSVSVKIGLREDPRYADAVALWTGPAEKLTWVNGQSARFDLAADPAEAAPGDVAGHPALPALQALIERQQAARDGAANAKVDAAVTKMLERMGYVGE